MAGSAITTTTLSSPSTSLKLKLKLQPTNKLVQHLSFLDHQPSFLSYFSNFPCRKSSSTSKFTICHAELDGGEGSLEGFGEVFFDDNYDEVIEEGSDDDGEQEEETESSIDLFIRFLQSMFKKLSKRAKKASRSVLPSEIPTQLVSFAVDGVLLLAALSIVKALLEVVCTLGSTVFAAVLSLRVIWAAMSYFQSSGNTFKQGGSSFGTTQPVA